MAAPTSIIELALGAVFQPVILGILAVSSLLVGVYVLRRGLHLIVATLQGKHIFAGQVWSDEEWERGMRAVHQAKRRGLFVDSESSNAYADYMNPDRKRRRSRRTRF